MPSEFREELFEKDITKSVEWLILILSIVRSLAFNFLSLLDFASDLTGGPFHRPILLCGINFSIWYS